LPLALTLVTWTLLPGLAGSGGLAIKPDNSENLKFVGEQGTLARISQARTVAWAKLRPGTKPAMCKDGTPKFSTSSSFPSHFLACSSRQLLSPQAGRGDLPHARWKFGKPLWHIPFSPAGRRCRQADEGDAEGRKKSFFLPPPSSDPSGHLLPGGRREGRRRRIPYAMTLPPTGSRGVPRLRPLVEETGAAYLLRPACGEKVARRVG